MAYKTGLRVVGAFFCFTGVGLPVGLILWWKARKAEKKIERREQKREQYFEEHT